MQGSRDQGLGIRKRLLEDIWLEPRLVETWGHQTSLLRRIVTSRHVLYYSLIFEHVRRARDRGARPHRGRHNCCFRQHRITCPDLARCSYMQLDAVWALRGQRNGNRHQLFVQDIDSTLLSNAQKAFIVSGAFSSSFLSRVRFLMSNMVVTPFSDTSSNDKRLPTARHSPTTPMRQARYIASIRCGSS